MGRPRRTVSRIAIGIRFIHYYEFRVIEYRLSCDYGLSTKCKYDEDDTPHSSLVSEAKRTIYRRTVLTQLYGTQTQGVGACMAVQSSVVDSKCRWFLKYRAVKDLSASRAHTGKCSRADNMAHQTDPIAIAKGACQWFGTSI